MEWFVEMPDGTLRSGFAYQDFRSIDLPGRWVNLAPREGRHITKAEFDRRTMKRRTIRRPIRSRLVMFLRMLGGEHPDPVCTCGRVEGDCPHQVLRRPCPPLPYREFYRAQEDILNHRQAIRETLDLARTAVHEGRLDPKDHAMFDKMAADIDQVSPAQLGRVLGFLQGCLYGRGAARLPELKAITERNRGGVR